MEQCKLSLSEAMRLKQNVKKLGKHLNILLLGIFTFTKSQTANVWCLLPTSQNEQLAANYPKFHMNKQKSSFSILKNVLYTIMFTPKYKDTNCFWKEDLKSLNNKYIILNS